MFLRHWCGDTTRAPACLPLDNGRTGTPARARTRVRARAHPQNRIGFTLRNRAISCWSHVLEHKSRFQWSNPQIGGRDGGGALTGVPTSPTLSLLCLEADCSALVGCSFQHHRQSQVTVRSAADLYILLYCECFFLLFSNLTIYYRHKSHSSTY